jgi:hypothetical protein
LSTPLAALVVPWPFIRSPSHVAVARLSIAVSKVDVRFLARGQLMTSERAAPTLGSPEARGGAAIRGPSCDRLSAAGFAHSGVEKFPRMLMKQGGVEHIFVWLVFSSPRLHASLALDVGLKAEQIGHVDPTV